MINLNKKQIAIGLGVALIILVVIGIIILVQPKESDRDSTENTEIANTERIEIYLEETENMINDTEVLSEVVLNTETELLNTEDEIQPTQPVWTVTDMDKTMYAKSSVNVRKGPGTEYERLGSLSTNQEVKVTGKCNEFDWYRILYEGDEVYVSVNYLMDEKIVVNNSNNQEVTNANDLNNNQSIDSEYIEDEANNTPSTPEPAIGTIVYDGYPQDGWIWQYIDCADSYTEIEGFWTRAAWQDSAPWFGEEQSTETLIYYSYLAYPERTDIPEIPEGEFSYRIQYPTFWVYLGDGPM